jgi:mono/diheme cytochrome c family protein
MRRISMKLVHDHAVAAFAALMALPGCGGGSTQLEIVTASGSPLQAVAGDGVKLKVVQSTSGGSTEDLPAGATVTWTSPATITALPFDSTAPSPLPLPGAEPTAVWIDNAGRPDDAAALADVLFILDASKQEHPSITVTATVSGVTPGGPVSATIAVSPTPAGDAGRGATVYGATGADCAQCHGATGHGSPATPPSSMTYMLGGASYGYPAPGINAEPGNLASDPAWSAELLAFSARADVDNGGLTLRSPMPAWIVTPDPATGELLSTQDFADMYAFLQTQTH